MRQEPDHRGIRKQAKLFGLHPVGKREPWKPFEEDQKRDQSGTGRKDNFSDPPDHGSLFLSPICELLMDSFSSIHGESTQGMFVTRVNG